MAHEILSVKLNELDEKILLAKYTLDFAMQAADHALLCALEAIQSQNNSTERSSK